MQGSPSKSKSPKKEYKEYISSDNKIENDDSFYKTDIICEICQGNGELRIATLDTPGEPKQKITTFECRVCNARESTIFNMQKDDREGYLVVSCNFSNKDDLGRYILLQKYSTVNFYKKELSYEYVSASDVVTTVENLIEQAADEIADTYGVPRRQDIVNKKPKDVTSSGEVLGIKNTESGSTSSVGTLESKEQAKHAIYLLDDLIKNPQFKMVIKDSSCQSRICPVNKTVSQCSYEDLKTFDDENVEHKKCYEKYQ
ncbi:hypothetical protein CWI36_0027p0050 [Hamiltosporidium magnivora]|uniref:Uncharacterized protein n=1 Tax=Hamiltosporidium magnivora TaxID=148818 RepID=A0A4Q9LQ15_9MICR|nr:hypothetical protein CWI36_0027p0050 [Hamiltosporidium magnivora]